MLSKYTVDLGYFYVADPGFTNPDEIMGLDMDEKLISSDVIKLKITYPVTNPYVVESTNHGGYTRRQLVELICQHYDLMYQAEETEIPAGTIPGMLNRAQTYGIYGIWGHDIGDLILHSATVSFENDEIFVEPECDS